MSKIKKIAPYFYLAAVGISLAEIIFDTGPAICKIDPTCRKLTEDEISLAKPLFGETTRYKDVFVFERHGFMIQFTNLLKSNKIIASVFKSSIYMPAWPDRPEYIKEKELSQAAGFKGFPDRPTLVHELTHISKKHTPFAHDEQNDQYLFQLVAGKPFSSYGEEQQAEIVKAYYIFTRDYESLSNRLEKETTSTRIMHKPMMRDYCKTLREYASVIQQALPVTPPKTCQKPFLP